MKKARRRRKKGLPITGTRGSVTRGLKLAVDGRYIGWWTGRRTEGMRIPLWVWRRNLVMQRNKWRELDGRCVGGKEEKKEEEQEEHGVYYILISLRQGMTFANTTTTTCHQIQPTNKIKYRQKWMLTVSTRVFLFFCWVPLRSSFIDVHWKVWPGM